MSGAKTVLEQGPAKLDPISDTASGRVSLDDKYDLNQKQIFVSGTQAIVRLLQLQK